MSRVLGVLGSFFLFAAFMLSFFVILGQVSNKPFLNILHFVKAHNKPYDLTYTFGLWNYCKGSYGSIETCSKGVGAFDWYRTPGFDRMLPVQAASKSKRAVFIAFFTLYFISFIFSFALWVLSLPSLCKSRKGLSVFMTTWAAINFLIMLVTLIIGIVLVVVFNKNIHQGGWEGYASNSLWFTIGIVLSLLAATLCYAFRSKSTKVKDEKYLSTEQQPYTLNPHSSYQQTQIQQQPY